MIILVFYLFVSNPSFNSQICQTGFVNSCEQTSLVSNGNQTEEKKTDEEILLEQLELSDEQIEQYHEINRIASKAFRSQSSDRRESERIAEKRNQEISALLSSRQRKVYQQYLNWTTYLVWGKQVESLMHHEVTQTLGLDKSQQDQLKKIKQNLNDELINSEKKYHAQQNAILEECLKKIDDFLIPYQVDLRKTARGKPFDFEKSKLKLMTSLSRHGLPPTALLRFQNEINSPKRLSVLVAFMANDAVAEDLKLSERQKEFASDCLRDLKKVYSSITATSRKNGKPVAHFGNFTDEDLLVYDDQEKQEVDEFLKEMRLSKTQLRRIEQIYRQAITINGTNNGADVRADIFHKDWANYLEMTDAQREAFSKVTRDYFRSAIQDYENFNSSGFGIIEQSYYDGLKILDDRQLRKWRDETGVFGK